jgi:iron complex transport system substrate-binding protein
VKSSRRQLILGLAGLAAATTGLSACNVSTQPKAAPSSANAAEEGAYPVTLTHRFGETTIESAPTRVVTVGLKEQDDVLALGVVPVGATKWLTFDDGGVYGQWATAALGDAPKPTVLGDAAIEFEKIAALRPDLIIAVYSALTKTDYDKLSKVAPTIAQSKDHQDWGVPWDVQAMTVGKALGQPAKMQALVDQAQAKVTETAKAHPEFAGKIGLVASPYEGVFIYGTQDPRPRLLTELGFRLPADLDKVTKSAWGGQLSTERMDFVDTDALIWFVEPGQRDTLEKTQSYTRLRVHREGRAIYSENDDKMNNAFSLLTVLSLPFLLDNLAPRLAAAVDGDPATTTDEPA